MGKQIHHSGGFSGFNTGSITNCYSRSKMQSGENAGGFCGENRGNIKNCLSRGDFKKPKDNVGYGFCSKQAGTEEGNFWICADKLKGEENWGDWAKAITDDELEDKVPSLTESWDKDTTWSIKNGDIYLYKKAYEASYENSVVEISNKDEYLQFVADVNSGTAPENTVYRLTADIDFGGRSISPVGQDQNNAFNLVFDGNHHTLKNFKIDASRNSYGACFGCIGKEGEVYNLTVDAVVSGKGNFTAGFCAVNDGYISGCISRSAVGEGRYTGGFVAQNNGRIESSCCVSKITPVLIFPWWIPLAGILACAVLLSGYFAITGPSKTEDVFAPVIIDPNAKPISPDEDTIPEEPKPVKPKPVKPKGPKDSSAAFIMNANMTVDSSNYAGTIGLKCPKSSTKGFVATAHVSGEELKKNGASYKKDAVIYESGLINPGMGVDIITLSKLPDGSRLPRGAYSVTVTINFYDPETNERASVNTTAPLDIVVK